MNILSVVQFTKEHVIHYIQKASRFKRDGPDRPLNKTIINLFYEPSTRTSCSFQAAAIKLGCKIISITDKYSSVEKGESLEDTIKTINYYGDAIVLRHPEKGSSERAARVSKIPIINAGDGNGEHPTQALLDIFTIHEELYSRNIYLQSETRDPITVTFLGDLKNSRTIHSLIHLLALFPRMKFIYVSPETLELPQEIIDKINVEQKAMTLEEAIVVSDILYATRIQKERFSSEEEYLSIHSYCIDTEVMSKAKENMILMHPLPRLKEISVEVDSDPRAVYFKQVENGVYMRMAILDTIL
jgi:aspartate carbamoyltransferase